MKDYENRGGDSPVVAYECGEGKIKLRYTDGSVYLYTYQDTGGANVEQMKKYAVIGHGLFGFMKRFVKQGAGTRVS